MLKGKERVSVVRQGDALLVRLSGEIDHHSAADYRRQLDDLICRHRPTVLRLDVAAVSFMDSAGLGLFMGRHALMSKIGGELVLYRPGAVVMRIVRLSGMERMIKIEHQASDHTKEGQGL